MRPELFREKGKVMCMARTAAATLVFFAAIGTSSGAQAPTASAPPGAANDLQTPLHLMRPDYPVPYTPPSSAEIKEVLDRILAFLEAETPARLVDAETQQPVADVASATRPLVPARGGFRIVSYEWGVTYSGMLAVGQATGDRRFTDYAAQRIQLIGDWAKHAPSVGQEDGRRAAMLRSVIEPRALDDAGSMCAALIKATRAGAATDVRPLIDRYIDYISHKQYRLADGTLARNRPLPSTLWLDDLYMSVPALAQMGALTGERRFFDDAVKQVLQFSARMFNADQGLYMHGWVEGMTVHPEFHWARANGWALMAMTELLDVLPEDHPGRPAVLEQLRAHVRGLADRQSGAGLWHQLLDREDSYLETSATAIYAYCIARGIRRGWLDPLAHGPMALLAWNAAASRVNARGQVEGTCVGTGMAFDPAFYYHRPTHVFAAHGYGPMLLAGAEVKLLLDEYAGRLNDSGLLILRR